MSDAARAIVETCKRAGVPLSDDQQTVLVGSLAVWFDKAVLDDREETRIAYGEELFDVQGNSLGRLTATRAKAMAHVNALTARVAELEAALRPFSKEFMKYDGCHVGDEVTLAELYETMAPADKCCITFADLRRAARHVPEGGGTMTSPYGNCTKCRKQVYVVGSRWCSECWYPGIDKHYQFYQALREEGYPRHKALVVAGLADPPGDD